MTETAPLIFIVDDDRGMLRLIEKTLQHEGFATATAASARDAIEWLQKNRPALMLLDLKLQDMEGKEVINHLASVGASVPFVVITGQGDERVAVEMMKRGALDYLTKDVQFQQFVPSVVQRSLKQLERERQLAAAEESLRHEHEFARARWVNRTEHDAFEFAEHGAHLNARQIGTLSDEAEDVLVVPQSQRLLRDLTSNK